MPENGSGDLELVAGGRQLRFPAVWLRDNCPCAECLDPRSQQKFLAITDLSTELAVAAAAEVGESVVVTYAPDRHRSVFSRAWLAGHALDGYDDGAGRTEDDKALWQAADTPELPAASWPRYLAEPAERIRSLAAVMRLGFVLLHDVPVEPGTVLQVAATFGYVMQQHEAQAHDRGQAADPFR